MPSKGIIKWIASAVVFMIMSSGAIDPSNQEGLSRVIELGVTGLVFIIATLVYGFEIIHSVKNPKEKNNYFVELGKRMLNKVFVFETKPVNPPQ